MRKPVFQLEVVIKEPEKMNKHHGANGPVKWLWHFRSEIWILVGSWVPGSNRKIFKVRHLIQYRTYNPE